MGYIKLLKGKNLQNHSYASEEELYPITIADAVFDNNGKSLTTYLNDVNNKLTALETTLNNAINDFNKTNNTLKTSLITVDSDLKTCVSQSNLSLELAISKSMPEQIVIKTGLVDFFSTINVSNNYYRLTAKSMLYLDTIWNNNTILNKTTKEVILYINDFVQKALVVLYLPPFTEGLNLSDFRNTNNWYIISYNLVR